MALDYSEFKKFVEKIKRAEKDFDSFLKKFLINEGLQMLAKTKENTPVDTGHLRNMWQLGSVKREGDVLMIEVYNPVEYASYVEDGHRQDVGRYVPVLGKKLVQPYVDGKHMARIAIQDVEKGMIGRFEIQFKAWLESLG